MPRVLSTSAPSPSPVSPQIKHRVSGMSGPLLVGLYILLVTVPVLAAVLWGGGADHGQNLAPLLGRAFGIAALAVLLLQFLTSGRFEAISGRIGLDRTMGFHRIAAFGLLGMIALHIGGFLIRGGDGGIVAIGMRLMAYLTSPSLISGSIASVLLVVIVLVAKYLRRDLPNYAVWRMSHGGIAIVAGILALDHAFRHARLFADPLGTSTIVLLGLWAVSSIGIVYFWRPRQARQSGFRVLETRRLNQDLVELRLQASDPTRFSFQAGQFGWLAIGNRYVVADNPFSFASPPADLPNIRFLVREVGDMTRSIDGLAPGTSVAIDGPHGSFVLAADLAGPVVLIAGGIGIAPVLGLLHELAMRQYCDPIRLLVGMRHCQDFVFVKEVIALAKKLDLQWLYLCDAVDLADGTLSGKLPDGIVVGRLSHNHLSTLLAGLKAVDMTAFVCGPSGMMDQAVTLLLEAGVAENAVCMERFDYDAVRDPISRKSRRKMAACFAIAVILVGAITVGSVFGKIF